MNTNKIYVAGLNIVVNSKMVGYGDIIYKDKLQKYVLVKKKFIFRYV